MPNSNTADVRYNNFAIMRLFFASLVVFSHSSEIIDDNNSRELASLIWGTLSFGDISVNAFFLMSGYLITQSFTNSKSLVDYLLKRMLRIYPGFILATLVPVFFVAPLAGADHIGSRELIKLLSSTIWLASPNLPGVFQGLHFPVLNVPTWSIPYEFRCYLLVPVLAIIDLRKMRAVFLIASIALLLVTGLNLVASNDPFHVTAIGDLRTITRLTGFFSAGMCFYLYKDKISYRADLALGAIVICFFAMFNQITATIGLGTFGGYALFWFAFNGPFRSFSSKMKYDTSYGVYLYGWPFQSLIVFYYRDISPWMLTILALSIAALLGYISWNLVERPALLSKKLLRVYPAKTAEAV